MMSAYLLAVSDNTAKLLLAYGVCGGIILVALVAMGFLNRRTKRQMRPIYSDCFANFGCDFILIRN